MLVMTLTPKIEKVFIIHYNKLTDRKNNIVNYFSGNNIKNYEFRNFFQREDLTDKLKNQYFKLNNLNSSQICITIEHIETYREIAKNGNNEAWYLILEDDAIFCNDFVPSLNEYMNNIPNDAEYLDINDYVVINSNNMWESRNSTRTTCSYIIKKKTCEKVLNTIIPFEYAIDHEMNKQIRIHDIKTYWSNRSLVNHGSNGTYSSSYIQWR
jgi:GR25 family glycosyltransferase involved in LPS biosynthesis